MQIYPNTGPFITLPATYAFNPSGLTGAGNYKALVDYAGVSSNVGLDGASPDHIRIINLKLTYSGLGKAFDVDYDNTLNGAVGGAKDGGGMVGTVTVDHAEAGGAGAFESFAIQDVAGAGHFDATFEWARIQMLKNRAGSLVRALRVISQGTQAIDASLSAEGPINTIILVDATGVITWAFNTQTTSDQNFGINATNVLQLRGTTGNSLTQNMAVGVNGLHAAGPLQVANNTPLRFVNAAGNSTKNLASIDGSNNLHLTADDCALTKNVITYNNISTAGIGVPAVYKANAQTLNTNAAPPTLTYVPPATAGVYRLSGYLDILTAGTMTFKVKITYKDPGGNARTDIPSFYLQNTTALLAGGNAANTTGQYTMFPYTLAIDNSATAITIQDNAGTYTAGTYYWTPVLEQLA